MPSVSPSASIPERVRRPIPARARSYEERRHSYVREERNMGRVLLSQQTSYDGLALESLARFGVDLSRRCGHDDAGSPEPPPWPRVCELLVADAGVNVRFRLLDIVVEIYQLRSGRAARSGLRTGRTHLRRERRKSEELRRYSDALFRPARIGLDVFNLLETKASDIDYYYNSSIPSDPASTKPGYMGRCPIATCGAGVADVHFHPIERRLLRFTLTQQF